MKGKVKVWHIAALGVVIGALVTYLVISMSSKIDRLTRIVDETNGQVEFYKIVVGNLEEQVFESELIIREKEKLVEVTSEQMARLKAEKIRYLNAIGSLNLQVSSLKDSLSVKVPPDTIVRIVEIIDDRPMMELPAYFDYNDRWISMYAEIDTTGKGLISAALGEAPINIAMGSRLFKRDYVTAISSPSPYLSFDKVDVQIVAPKKLKPLLIVGGIGIGVGVLSGAALYHVLTK